MTSAQISIVRVIAGVAVFLFWLQIVGNPHVVETVLGLFVAVAAAWWVGTLLPKGGKDGGPGA
jgi:multisubunit Na+/H+ antiporter MnhE subunit